MTKLHHATVAAAVKQGFELEATEDGITVTSKKPAFSFTRDQSGKRMLEDAITYRLIRTEYDLVSIDNESETWGLSVEGLDDTFEGETLKEALDALLDAAQEAGIEVAEEKPVSVVVPDKYKKEYAARGDATCCGDWLAVTLKGQFEVTTDNGPQFDADGFADMLTANGVDQSGKWASLPASGQKGWQGRYRMNGRQKLEIRVAATGALHLKGQTLIVPQEDLEILWAKHPDAFTDWEEARQPAKTDEKGKSRAKKSKEAVPA